MIKNYFHHCIDCSNKTLIEKNKHYCSIAAKEIEHGIIYDSTDATQCVLKGLFNPINDIEFEANIEDICFE